MFYFSCKAPKLIETDVSLQKGIESLAKGDSGGMKNYSVSLSIQAGTSSRERESVEATPFTGRKTQVVHLV